MRIHPNNTFQPGDLVRLFNAGHVEGQVTHVNGRGVKVVLPAWPNGVWFKYNEVELVSTDLFEMDETDYLELIGG